MKKRTKSACVLAAMAIIGLAANAAEKTMKILRSAATTNDTWVAEIGGLDNGDTLVFDTSDFTTGNGAAVYLGFVTTPRLAGGLRFIDSPYGINFNQIEFNFADGTTSCALTVSADGTVIVFR